MDHLLVTGGAGFIGSNFIHYMNKRHPKLHIVNLDKLTYAGSLDNLDGLEHADNYTFIKGDICDEVLLDELFATYDIKGVVHFAAESHVDNSILLPKSFITTNVLGTFTLAEAARKYWMKGPNAFKEGYERCRFHHVSTDEVFGSLGAKGYFTEESAYAPNSPYSASKAGSDFIIRACFHTFGMNVTVSNCSNNYGPRQHLEKLIPNVIFKALSLKPIPIYGTGLNIRDWLYVEDHCRAIELILSSGVSGQTYNVGAANERSNLEVASRLCEILDQEAPRSDGRAYGSLITLVKDRPGHDFRYAIDASKLKKQLGWQALESFDLGLIKTVKWYLKKL